MADRDEDRTLEGVKERQGTREQEQQHLSPRPSREQAAPAEVRPPTPAEERGEEKGQGEGLADRDIGPDRG
jgi:hypothetical protein